MTVTIHHGDCLAIMRDLPDACVDSIVTDPPYGLSDHRPGEVLDCLRAWLKDKEYRPNKPGFLGRTWDSWVPGPEIWRECFRVLKPGGHLLSFSGTRTMDLTALAIRLAGFELRDSIGFASEGEQQAPLMAWVFGTGFPKSMNVGKQIDKAARGFPQGSRDPSSPNHGSYAKPKGRGVSAGASGYLVDGSSPRQDTREVVEEAREWLGWGTHLKPAWEPIILARKPLEGTVSENVVKHGVGAMNISAAMIPSNEAITTHSRGKSTSHPSRPGERTVEESGRKTRQDLFERTERYGRFPANVIHDGSQSVLDIFAGYRDPDEVESASRFFYCAKAGSEDRRGTNHPTVKPQALIRYLLTLCTPHGGTVLDPFAGSGTTGIVAQQLGMQAILIEREAEYVHQIQQRIGGA